IRDPQLRARARRLESNPRCPDHALRPERIEHLSHRRRQSSTRELPHRSRTKLELESASSFAIERPTENALHAEESARRAGGRSFFWLRFSRLRRLFPLRDREPRERATRLDPDAPVEPFEIDL